MYLKTSNKNNARLSSKNNNNNKKHKKFVSILKDIGLFAVSYST